MDTAQQARLRGVSDKINTHVQIIWYQVLNNLDMELSAIGKTRDEIEALKNQCDKTVKGPLLRSLKAIKQANIGLLAEISGNRLPNSFKEEETNGS